jgi:hypothetical protein
MSVSIAVYASDSNFSLKTLQEGFSFFYSLLKVASNLTQSVCAKFTQEIKFTQGLPLV